MLLKPRSPAPLPRASTNGPAEKAEWGLNALCGLGGTRAITRAVPYVYTRLKVGFFQVQLTDGVPASPTTPPTPHAASAMPTAAPSRSL